MARLATREGPGGTRRWLRSEHAGGLFSPEHTWFKFLAAASRARWQALVLVLLFGSESLGWPPAFAAELPVETFFRHHALSHMTLSPDGRCVTAIAAGKEGPYLLTMEVQFLANRGYAVLQINFRGSTGYGLAFTKAGFREYGLRMQDDITDGVRWAIAQGIADPKRVGIFGTSYGGYATMVGLTQTPELYRCGINYAGLTDLDNFLRDRTDMAPKQAQAFARIAIGDYRTERQQLKAVSPLTHVDRIRAPVMLVYGGRDPRVRIEQGRKLERELKRRGKPYEMIFEPNEGHGFRIETNTFKLFHRIDAFLKKNLQPDPSPGRARWAIIGSV